MLTIWRKKKLKKPDFYKPQAWVKKKNKPLSIKVFFLCIQSKLDVDPRRDDDAYWTSFWMNWMKIQWCKLVETNVHVVNTDIMCWDLHECLMDSMRKHIYQCAQ